MQTDLLLVSVQRRLDAQGDIENRDIPADARRIHAQNAAGEHVSLLVTDPAEVASLDAIWQPYIDGVKQADEQGQPWPDAPHLSVSGSIVPTP
jgi:hypothetical protein